MLAKINEFLKDKPNWSGSATELSLLIESEYPVNSLTKRLNVSASRLFHDYGIEYTYTREHDGRKLNFRKYIQSDSLRQL